MQFSFLSKNYAISNKNCASFRKEKENNTLNKPLFLHNFLPTVENRHMFYVLVLGILFERHFVIFKFSMHLQKNAIANYLYVMSIVLQ